jgi:hypothetical protein
LDEPDDLQPASFEEEEAAELRRQYVRHTLRLAAAFAAIFAFVYLAFWWSGSAVRFGVSRVGDRGVATWRVEGRVRDAATGKPIPWARVEDDPAGRPPYFRAEADQVGNFDLRTIPEPHQIRVSAPGYQAEAFPVGRVWFLWLPQGSERKELVLSPD